MQLDRDHHDDTPTILAIAALACILQDILHEGLGHAVTAWLSGAHTVSLSTVAMQADISTRWISASGTLVNIAAGALLWIVLQRRVFRPATRYFLILAMAGNLFTGTGYFLFSGVANFGDWAAVINGWAPRDAWRIGLVVVGAITYFASMRLVARELRPFKRQERSRLRRLCFIPYAADGVLAAAAGLLNPLGVFYVFASALPSTLGANSGLLSLPSMMRGVAPADPAAGPIERSVGWLTAGVAGVVVFVGVLGRSVTFSR
ncbi:MAG: hypothetical protein ACRD1V_14680 [Vicinamibacterales bacterium]